jgi:hypothetical protein
MLDALLPILLVFCSPLNLMNENRTDLSSPQIENVKVEMVDEDLELKVKFNFDSKNYSFKVQSQHTHDFYRYRSTENSALELKIYPGEAGFLSGQVAGNVFSKYPLSCQSY